MQTYMTFRQLNLGDHFILAAGRLLDVKPIYCKVEDQQSSRDGVKPYNVRRHFDGSLDRVEPDALVIAVMMPEWAAHPPLKER